MPEWIGKTIGKVRVEKFIARGGMAEVYLGTHLTLDRPVAIKVLHSFIEEDSGLLARFQREARVIAALRHSNIVQVLDFDTADGHPYIVMEYLAGPSLAAYLRNIHEREVRLAYYQVARLLTPLAAALDYAHSQGVIHRDIKPANILLHSKAGNFDVNSALTDSVDPVITDFGLVRIAHSSVQTASGAVSGTPAYMSPEQARGERVDHRTDVYSLGVVLYEMLAGRVPFEADSSMTVLFMHINDPPPPIKGIHPALRDVIERALAKNSAERYQTCRELATAFTNAIDLDSQTETVSKLLARATPAAAAIEKRDQAKGPNWMRIAGFTLGALILCIFGFAALQSLSPTSTPTEPATEPPAQIAPTETLPPVVEEPTPETILFPPAADGISVGVLRFQDGASALDQITIFAPLAIPPDGTQYEAILIGDGGELRRSLGVLTPDETGQFTLTFVDPQSRNLMDRFHRMEITLEPNPDDNPNPTGQVIYSSEIPGEALVHIRHLLFSIPDTPNQVSLIHGMANHVFLILQSAEAMLAAFDAGDEAGARLQAETIINLIVGNQETSFYADWDGDGTISDTGDGYGLLLNGEQQGYILGTISHAGYAAGATDSTPDIRLHADHVIVSAQNVEAWAPELRDTAFRIVQAPFDETMRADISTAVALANQILNGLDIDASETVDPIPGEGGVLTAYEHAYYMADMPILPGSNQIPAP
ncbi:MAG: protein kinase [Anaerolineae bacterium]|nr:protein kinase [Anaerolineae bacterium]MCI0607771.1 protein kinase [Anaerolineae bacterium]